ncbi:hypothetical protein HK105_209495, partial [Polyrhizophydium stewartii]
MHHQTWGGRPQTSPRGCEDQPASNLPQTDLAASPLNIQIYGSVIPTERPGDHMSRILGVFSTFDGSHTQTINHAISEAKKLLGTL